MADFTANVAAAATVTPGQPYAVREVASSGPLAGVATATAAVATVRALSASVGATTDATSAMPGITNAVTANVASAAATTLDYLYRRRDVAASGTLGGVTTVTVSVAVNSGAGTAYQLTARPNATSASAATLYRIRWADAGDVAGVSTAAASVFRQAHRDAAAIAQTNVSAVILPVLSGGTSYQLTATVTSAATSASTLTVRVIHAATPAAVATASASVAVLANRLAQADAVSAASVSVVAVAPNTRSAYATSVSSATASINTVRGLSTSAAATGTTSVVVVSSASPSDAVGKYKAQHARAYALVQRMENGDFSEQHARAFARVFEKGV